MSGKVVTIKNSLFDDMIHRIKTGVDNKLLSKKFSLLHISMRHHFGVDTGLSY